MKFCIHIHVPLRMDRSSLGGLLTFHRGHRQVKISFFSLVYDTCHMCLVFCANWQMFACQHAKLRW